MRKRRSRSSDRSRPQLAPYEQYQRREIARRVRYLVNDHLAGISSLVDRQLFLNRIEQMAAALVLWGGRINLTAAPANAVEIAFHIMDSLGPTKLWANEPHLCDAFKSGNEIGDFGSGAGFPGLVLAAASPASFTLFEARAKRASFLSVASAEMDLRNVTVELRRTPEPRNTRKNDRYRRFDVVTARAYAIPSAFHPVAASALKPGGIAILYANPRQDLALASAERNGLIQFQRFAYQVPRGDCAVERIIALWRRR